MPSEREIRNLYVNGRTICIEVFFCLLKIFQRPQDAQPSPNGDDLGGLGVIPQQAFWPVQSGQNRKTCICLHCLPVLSRIRDKIGKQCGFVHGDANKLDFPDGSFDAVISNYVYHNIMGADKHALLLESLRVLKKGGVFVLHDNMKPQMYGDMNAFVEEAEGHGLCRGTAMWRPRRPFSARSSVRL